MRGRGVSLFFLGFASGGFFIAILVSVAPSPAGDSPVRADGLERLEIGLPIAGLRLSDIHDTFHERRAGGTPHEATDIMAPRGTPVLAVDDGAIRKLFY